MKKALLVFIFVLFLTQTPGLAEGAGLVPCGGFELDSNGNFITESIPPSGVPEGYRAISQTEMAKLEPPCQLCHFFVLINNIVTFLLIPDENSNNYFPPVLALAALMIVIGGFMYILASAGGGDSNMISQAKALFKGVVIGLLVAYGAWIIVNTFFSVLGVSTWQGAGEWWTINCE